MSGVLLELVSARAVALIPILLFPVLRVHNIVFALGDVSFRLLEAVLLSVAQVLKLSLVDLSQEYLSGDGVNASVLEITGHSIQSVIH